MEFKVRKYSDDLFIKVADFYAEMIGGIFRSRKKGRQFLEKILQKPHFDPRQDLFVAESDNGVAGLLLIIPESKIKRMVLNCHVHHDFPYHRVASVLWERGVLRCLEIGGDKIHICIHENFSAGRVFFTEIGFSPVRVHVELEKDLDEAIIFGNEPEIGHLAYFDEGDEPLLAELQNRIFAGSWGYSPNSAAEIAYYLELTQCRVTDILLLKNGNDLCGYLWAHPSVRYDSVQKKARIHMLGIVPEFQRRGLGKKLLRMGLEELRNKDYGTVELTVDGANLPAMALYDSLGFREKYSSIWYEKSTLS